MAASPLTNLCSTCRRFADVLQYDILASSNAIFSYSGLEIEFEHGRPAGAATPPHRLCQRGGGSPRAILFIVHSMCPKCLLIAPFHNWSQVFKHAKRLGYGEHDVSAVYIRLLHLQTWQLYSTILFAGQDFERAREGKKPTNYLNESLNIKSPMRKIATLHQTWCGTLLRFEPINLYVETCSHRIRATMWRASPSRWFVPN